MGENGKSFTKLKPTQFVWNGNSRFPAAREIVERKIAEFVKTNTNGAVTQMTQNDINEFFADGLALERKFLSIPSDSCSLQRKKSPLHS